MLILKSSKNLRGGVSRMQQKRVCAMPKLDGLFSYHAAIIKLIDFSDPLVKRHHMSDGQNILFPVPNCLYPGRGEMLGC